MLMRAGTDEFLQAGARATALGLQLARPVRRQSAGARMKIARKYFKLILVFYIRKKSSPSIFTKV
jgi:hypothetical protein